MQNITMATLALGFVGATFGLGSAARAETRKWVWGAMHNGADGRCLEANTDDPPGKEGGRLRLSACNGSPAQQWEVWLSTEYQGETVRNAYSGTCLDRPGGGDSRVYLWPCHEGPQQRWYLEDIGPDWIYALAVNDDRSRVLGAGRDPNRIETGSRVYGAFAMSRTTPLQPNMIWTFR